MNAALLFGATALASAFIYDSYKDDVKVVPPPLSPAAEQQRCALPVAQPNDHDDIPPMTSMWDSVDMTGFRTHCAPVPQVTNTTGCNNIESTDPMVFRPPKVPVMHPGPIANDQPSWYTATQNGIQLARDRHLSTCAPENAFNQAEGGMNEYTPFDFDENGRFVGRTGFANGQYMTRKDIDSQVRFAHIGADGRVVGLNPIELRPAGGNQGHHGEAIARWTAFRQGEVYRRKWEMAEWFRPPVATSDFGVKVGALVLDPDLRHVNRAPRSPECHLATAQKALHEELLAPYTTM